jgi:hypothetical protein
LDGAASVTDSRCFGAYRPMPAVVAANSVHVHRCSLWWLSKIIQQIGPPAVGCTSIFKHELQLLMIYSSLFLSAHGLGAMSRKQRIHTDRLRQRTSHDANILGNVVPIVE